MSSKVFQPGTVLGPVLNRSQVCVEYQWDEAYDIPDSLSLFKSSLEFQLHLCFFFFPLQQLPFSLNSTSTGYKVSFRVSFSLHINFKSLILINIKVFSFPAINLLAFLHNLSHILSFYNLNLLNFHLIFSVICISCT